MRKGIHIVNLKKQNKSICHSTYFNSIFNRSSCRKPEIPNDLPKITKVKLICYFFHQNFDQKSALPRFGVIQTAAQYNGQRKLPKTPLT